MLAGSSRLPLSAFPANTLSPVRLSLVSAVAALGAVGLTLALVGLGLPFVVAALLAAAAAGLVHYAAARSETAIGASLPAPGPDPVVSGLEEQLEAYRVQTSALRHDLRGVLSPALMMSDRLLNHPDPAVQRAGTAVVRSIDRATTLLAGSREQMTVPGPTPPLPPTPPPVPTPIPRPIPPPPIPPAV